MSKLKTEVFSPYDFDGLSTEFLLREDILKLIAERANRWIQDNGDEVWGKDNDKLWSIEKWSAANKRGVLINIEKLEEKCEHENLRTGWCDDYGIRAQCRDCQALLRPTGWEVSG